MPCSDPTHNHRAWPLLGRHAFRIASCERQCGWCNYKTGAANNLRVHARKHLRNSKDEALKDISIVTGRAGRSRISMRAVDTTTSRLSSQTPSPPASPSQRPHAEEMLRVELSESSQIAQLKDRIQELENLLHKNGIQPPAQAQSQPSDAHDNAYPITTVREHPPILQHPLLVTDDLRNKTLHAAPYGNKNTVNKVATLESWFELSRYKPPSLPRSVSFATLASNYSKDQEKPDLDIPLMNGYDDLFAFAALRKIPAQQTEDFT